MINILHNLKGNFNNKLDFFKLNNSFSYFRGAYIEFEDADGVELAKGMSDSMLRGR